MISREVVELPIGLRPAILQGHVLDVLATLPAESFQTVVTSPPYWGLRLYGTDPQVWGGKEDHAHEWSPTLPRRQRKEADATSTIEQSSVGGRNYDARGGESCECGAWKGELGLEPTPELYVSHIGYVFDAVRRVLRDDGCLWLDLGDTYTTHPAGVTDSRRTQASTLTKGRDITGAIQSGSVDKRVDGGLPEKNLVGIPWRVAFDLQRRGWFLRSDCVWAKPNPMPESVRDRPTRAHEYVFLLTKRARYFYDADAVRRPLAPSTEDRARWHYPNPTDNPDSDSKWLKQDHDGNRTHAGFNARWRAYPIQGGAQPPTGSNLKTVWWIPTEPVREAHFATFPQQLVETCLRASTSAKGACAACGTPWRHRVKAEGGTIGRSRNDHVDDLVQGDRADGKTHDGTYRLIDLGFEPSCECGSTETIPCAVLDPFGGSGTVSLVARGLGLRSVAIELKPEYVAIARKRAGRIADILTAPRAA